MSYNLRLTQALNTVKSPGSFAAGGIARDLPNLVLHIEGMQRRTDSPNIFELPKPAIHLPLRESEAKLIIEKCSQAPYGRGEKTVVDTSVRRTWQLDPSQFTIASRELHKTWKTTLAALVQEVRADLGCAASKDVSCELYKLLLYEPGGFFKPHRDTEKVAGMFGTLVIQLPSEYKGGQLVVHHQVEKKTFDFSDKPSNFYYAAFYADCKHEICEVTEGYRLCLIYNLVSKDRILSFPIYRTVDEYVVKFVSSIINEWIEDEKGPSIMAYLLDHKYCEASLSFSSLKNRDRAVADMLVNARKEQFDMHLTIVTKEELWYTIHHDLYYTHEEYSSCDGSTSDFQLESTRFDANQTMVTLDGKKEKKIFPMFHELLESVIPTGSRSEVAESIEFEVTGNEGAAMDKRYSRAILILSKNVSSK